MHHDFVIPGVGGTTYSSRTIVNDSGFDISYSPRFESKVASRVARCLKRWSATRLDLR